MVIQSAWHTCFFIYFGKVNDIIKKGINSELENVESDGMIIAYW